jgi:hypothetical protein
MPASKARACLREEIVRIKTNSPRIGESAVYSRLHAKPGGASRCQIREVLSPSEMACAGILQRRVESLQVKHPRLYRLFESEAKAGKQNSLGKLFRKIIGIGGAAPRWAVLFVKWWKRARGGSAIRRLRNLTSEVLEDFGSPDCFRHIQYVPDQKTVQVWLAEYVRAPYLPEWDDVFVSERLRAVKFRYQRYRLPTKSLANAANVDPVQIRALIHKHKSYWETIRRLLPPVRRCRRNVDVVSRRTMQRSLPLLQELATELRIAPERKAEFRVRLRGLRRVLGASFDAILRPGEHNRPKGHPPTKKTFDPKWKPGKRRKTRRSPFIGDEILIKSILTRISDDDLLDAYAQIHDPVLGSAEMRDELRKEIFRRGL